MGKPKWLALLAGVLLAVGAFGWLGWWQITSAFSSVIAPEEAVVVDTAVPLGELIAPGDGLVETAAGRPVTAVGWLDLRDPVVVADRVQGDRVGHWLVGRFVVADSAPLPAAAVDGTAASVLPSAPIAIAWGESEDAVRAAAAELAAALPPLPGPEAAAFPEAALAAGAYGLGAQLQPGQDPQVPRKAADPQTVLTMSPGQLINRWQEPSPAYYSAYLIADSAFGAALPDGVELPAGVEAIEVVPIDQSLQLNLLNVFYAIEWAIFIVMALYMWWRLVRDDYVAERALAAGADERRAAEIRRRKLREIAARRGDRIPNPDETRPPRAGTEDR